MARVLTDPERITLQTSTTFAERLKTAVRNAGKYWSAHTGSGMTGTEALMIEWAKNRIVGVDIELNDAYVNNRDLPIRAIKVSKGMQFDVAAAPLEEAALLAGVTDLKYEEIAALLLGQFGENINMTVGGN